MCDRDKIYGQELAIGPLIYHLYAIDEWGTSILDGIITHLACNGISRTADRTILMFHNEPAAFTSEKAPAAFSTCEVEEDSWHLRKNLIDTTWQSSQSTCTFWSAGVDTSIGPVRFHLPWSLVVDDLVARGGGLIHAGLANHEGSGYLFIAPPSGGKSTTLGTAPVDWVVMSDDAALVWPDENGWLASPLPSWGDQINPGKPWPWPQMELDSTCALTNILQLEKSDRVELVRQTGSEALPSIYQALSEYPVTILANTGYREQYFRSAAQMARNLSTWQLILPKHGNIWPLLQQETK